MGSSGCKRDASSSPPPSTPRSRARPARSRSMACGASPTDRGGRCAACFARMQASSRDRRHWSACCTTSTASSSRCTPADENIVSNDGFDVVIGGLRPASIRTARARGRRRGPACSRRSTSTRARSTIRAMTTRSGGRARRAADAGRAAPRGPRRALRHAEGRGRRLWCVGGARRGRVRAPADSHAHDWWTPR